jgi:hypothetical protein
VVVRGYPIVQEIQRIFLRQKKIEKIKHDTFKPTVAGLLIVDKAQKKLNMELAEEKYWL